MRKKRVLVLFLVIWVSTGMASLPPEFQNNLEAIRAVGLEGRGNIEASGGWKKLAGGNVETLLPLLEGMDGANDFALNWLRAAVETIVSRELNAGGKLPVSGLGNFLQDTRHHPRARRLAFELLARVEPGLKGPFSATPVASGNFLYCVSEKGVAQVVDISKPEGEVVNELELGETILGTPAISQGAIYFRSDARLWRIGKPVSKPSA